MPTPAARLAWQSSPDGATSHLAGASGVDGLNIYSLIVATVGAMVVIGIKHAIVGGGGRLSRV